jgi:GNAT superfamily N-acetyltransferase
MHHRRQPHLMAALECRAAGTVEGAALSRITAVVRPAGTADLDSTVGLWEELREESDHAALFPEPAAVLAGLRSRLAADARAVEAGRPTTCRLAVAYDHEGAPIGMCFMRVVDGGPLALAETVLVDITHVAKAHRRSGVGRQLLREVVRFAAAAGVDDLVVQAPSGARDLNRFFAGWGFAQGQLGRASSVAALRRRLGPEAPGTINESIDGATDVTQLQRLLRRRAVPGARLARPAARSLSR